MHYFVMKTGLPMFDACRAYGLALILDRLVQSLDPTADCVTIHDVGPIYLVEGPEADRLYATNSPGAFDDVIGLTNGWCGALLTTGRATSVAKLKEKSRRGMQQKIAETKKQILGFANWLEQFTHESPLELISTKRNGFSTIPASLDVSASKGMRRAKTNGYSEGEQLYAPQAQCAVGLVGEAMFVRWTRAGGGQAALLASPESVTLRNHREICNLTHQAYLCSVSMSTAAAHYAVQLAEALRGRAASRAISSDRYEAILVQTMTFSGNQWKAGAGTVFPLEFPRRLSEADSQTAAEIFRIWNAAFRWGSVRGNEQLGTSLAQFVGQPSRATFEDYARIHLSMTIVDEDRRRFAPYEAECMKKVLRHVQ